MSLFGMLFSGLGSIISAAVDVVSDVVSTVASVFSNRRVEPKTVYRKRDKQQDQIHEINEEILFLNERYLNIGYLTDAEKASTMSRLCNEFFIKLCGMYINLHPLICKGYRHF